MDDNKGATEIHLVKNVVDGAVKKVNMTFRVLLPGKVKDFARETSRVGLELMVRLLGTDRVPREEPNVIDSPLILPRGGGYGFHFDMRPGDPAVVICPDGPVRGFYERGEAVTPQIPVGHQYGSTLTIPGGRVSSSVPGQETDPPNAEGESCIGAEDHSATITFAGAGLPTLGELGTVVIEAAGPTASLLCGSSKSATAPACEPALLQNLQLLNTMVQAWVPLAPPAIDNGATLKAVFAAWVAALQPMADLKVRMDGPVPLPP